MKATFTLLLLFVVNSSFGLQKSEGRKIVLTARPQGGRFQIIAKATTNDVIQITYMLEDSVSKDIRNNATYRSLGQTLLTGNLPIEARAALVQKMDSIMERYRHYTTDSITITTSNEKYQQVFNSFFSSSSELHEKSYRPVLDGTSMVFTLSEGDSSRKIYALSPDRISNPLMYDFINETMNVYRQKKPEGILNKGRTGGY